MNEKKFLKECQRKQKLLDLFDDLSHSAALPAKQYERIYDGWAELASIGRISFTLVTDAGGSLGPLRVNGDITRLLKAGDRFQLRAGYEKGQWHPVFIGAIASPTGTDKEYAISGHFPTPRFTG